MAKINKNNTGIAYITDTLEKKLNRMKEFGVTIINAPAGYGKTASVREYANNSNDKYYWINVSNNLKEIFWSNFCEVIESFDEEAGKTLRKIGYPQSEKNLSEIRSALRKVNVSEPTFIVICNYHIINDDYCRLFISSVADVLPGKLHLIFTTQIYEQDDMNISEAEIVQLITKEDMKLSKKDIIEYFKQHDLKISNDDAERLYDYSEGWLSAIYLQMINYSESGSFDNNASIDSMIERNVWNKLSEDKRYFMLTLSGLNSFTLKEAVSAAPDGIGEEDVERFLDTLGFIRFDKSKRCYYIHNVLMDYLRKEFELLDDDDRNKMTVKVGKVYELRGEIFAAYQYYYAAGAWELIYDSFPTLYDIYPYIRDENKEFFVTLLSAPENIREKYSYFSVILCIVLFFYNEKDRLAENFMLTIYSIESRNDLTQRQKNHLLCVYNYVRGYTEYNNLLVMHRFYKKALGYIGTTPIDIAAGVPFTFGCPSMLHLYHREDEGIDDELKYMDGIMPDYYKLAGGHGKGAEALFRAEAIYNRGDIEGAKILCHKALYMSDSKEQICINIGTLLLLTRICIFDGDYDAYAENMKSLRKKARYAGNVMDNEYTNIIDMSESFMYALSDDADRISDWLKDHTLIRGRTNQVVISYANIIYSKYLYIIKDYEKFLGISGQLLSIASLFSCAMPKIYTYIFIAMCNKELGNKQKAVKMLGEAMYMARSDSLIMPFVENAAYIEALLGDAGLNSEYKDFIKKIKTVAVQYQQGLKSIHKSVRNRNNFGLTARELDVAKLAAQRYSNKEIGEMLFIAESTVKSNLKVVFSKLNISSRSELAQFFK